MKKIPPKVVRNPKNIEKDVLEKQVNIRVEIKVNVQLKDILKNKLLKKCLFTLNCFLIFIYCGDFYIPTFAKTYSSI
jgi:hypothetical protein